MIQAGKEEETSSKRRFRGDSEAVRTLIGFQKSWQGGKTYQRTEKKRKRRVTSSLQNRTPQTERGNRIEGIKEREIEPKGNRIFFNEGAVKKKGSSRKKAGLKDKKTRRGTGPATQSINPLQEKIVTDGRVRSHRIDPSRKVGPF